MLLRLRGAATPQHRHHHILSQPSGGRAAGGLDLLAGGWRPESSLGRPGGCGPAGRPSRGGSCSRPEPAFAQPPPCRLARHRRRQRFGPPTPHQRAQAAQRSIHIRSAQAAHPPRPRPRRCPLPPPPAAACSPCAAWCSLAPPAAPCQLACQPPWPPPPARPCRPRASRWAWWRPSPMPPASAQFPSSGPRPAPLWSPGGTMQLCCWRPSCPWRPEQLPGSCPVGTTRACWSAWRWPILWGSCSSTADLRCRAPAGAARSTRRR